MDPLGGNAIMNYIKQFVCTLCGQKYPKTFTGFTCPKCGETGILDIEYDYEKMKDLVTKKFFRLNDDRSMWRYFPMMSLVQSLDRRPKGTLNVGWTPLYETPRLAQLWGAKKLYVKDEGLGPTASLKDRASAVACVHALSLGATTVACSSTGNAASSLAGHAARLGLSSVIFVPERAPAAKVAQLGVFGATVIQVQGDYKDAFNLSKQAIDHFGWYNRNAAINPHLVEGKKTVALEIAEQLEWEVPDWVVVSVGDGCTIAGVYKGFYDLVQLGITRKIPKLLGVQAEGCQPFVKAFSSGEALQESDERTIADSIAVGIPRNPLKAIRAVSKSNGSWIAVSDQAILEAIKAVGSAEGIFSEPAAAAAAAGCKEALDQGIIAPYETIVVISTGSGLKDIEHAKLATEEPLRMLPNLETLIEELRKKDTL
jgi:threonine synthase